MFTNLKVRPLEVAGIFLFGLLVVQGVFLALWLKKDFRPAQWDQSVHLMTAARYVDAVQRGNVKNLLLTRTYPGHPPYPPVAHYIMGVGMKVAPALGVRVESGAIFFLQMVALTVLAVGVYLLASFYWGNFAGCAAASLATFAPPVQFYCHQALTDVLLAALVTLAYGCWVRSQSYSRWGWSIAFGFVAGVGCLVKWTFPSYMLLPIISGGAQLIRGKNKGPILTGLGISILILTPWYLANAAIVIPKLTRVSGLGVQEGDPSGRTWAGWMWYSRQILWSWGWLFVLTGLAGWVWGIIKNRKSSVVLTAWFLMSYAIWSCVSNKDPRYMLPAAMAIPVCASSLPKIIPGVFSLVMAGAAISAPWAPHSSYLRDAPVPHSTPLDEIVERVALLREDSTRPAIVTLLANADCLNGNNVAWTIVKQGMTEKVSVRTRIDRLGELADFVLVKTGNLGPPSSVVRQTKMRDELFRLGGWFQKSFLEKGRWPLSDGSEAILYQPSTADIPDQARSHGGRKIHANPSSSGVWNAPVSGATFSENTSWRTLANDDVELVSPKMVYNGIVLTDVRLRFLGPRVAVDDDGQVRWLGLREICVDAATWSQADAMQFFRRKIPQLKEISAEFLGSDRLRLAGKWGKVPCHIEIQWSKITSAGGDGLSVNMRSVRLGWFVPPEFVLRRWGKIDVFLGPSTRRPYGIRFSGMKISGSPAALEVSPL